MNTYDSLGTYHGDICTVWLLLANGAWHTDRQTLSNIHFASSTTHAKCNEDGCTIRFSN